MEISLLERYLNKEDTCPPPLVFVSGPEGSGKLQRVRSVMGQIEHILINCQFYDSFAPIIRQVSAALGSTEPVSNMRELVEQIMSCPLGNNFYIVLNGPEHLMEIDGKAFQLFCQLRQLSRCSRIGIILLSQCFWQHFYPLHTMRPLTFSMPAIAFDGLVETLLADLSTDQTKTALFTVFLDFILKLFRQQCNELPLIVDLIKKLYPVFEGGAKEGRESGRELNRLYKQCESHARTMIRAENIQETTARLVESFSLPERFLLIAVYLASHNNAKHDIELFCNTGGQGKRKRRVFKVKGKKKKKALEQDVKISLKPIPIERLLGIFYFIYPVDLKAPDRPTVLMALNGLIACKLVVRCTPAQRMLQGCKVKCNFGQSLMGHISRHVGFQYERYLAKCL